MRSLAAFVSGRRTKWLVPLVWVAVLAAFAPLGQKLADEVEDQTESFLPESAQSTEVVRLLDDRFEGGQTLNGLIVYRRATGLTAADRRKIAADARRAASELKVVGQPVVPFQPGSPPQLASPDGRLARMMKDPRLTDETLVQTLYRVTFARPATAAEVATARAVIAAAPNRAAGAQDLFWALLNAKEFLFNH